MMKHRVYLEMILLVGVLQATALGGPPFRTDDPQPVDYLHWEFYVASQQQYERHATGMTLPHVEVNYGVVPDVQLHLVAPLAYVNSDGTVHYGYSDTELGVKYRFLEETGDAPQVGVFPMVELPTGNADRQLGSGRLQAYIPAWIQKSWGAFTTYAGGGWWYNPGEGRRNWIFTGWEAQYDFSEFLTLGAELFYQTPDAQGGQSSAGFTVGGYLNLDEHNHVLFSAGRNVTGDAVVTGYLGYQMTL